MQSFTALTAISPLDGRYNQKTDPLRFCCSEFGLIRLRLLIEIRWLEALAANKDIKECPALSKQSQEFLNDLYLNFSESEAKRVKNIEHTTNHDVKAIEYYIKEKCAAIPKLESVGEFIHFACTSEDINNLSYALMLKQLRDEFIAPQVNKLIKTLTKLAHDHAGAAMLSRTHGQAATPTTMGKEIANVVTRLQRQLENLNNIIINGKINGAVGNFNAHIAAYSNIDWLNFSKQFVESLHLNWNAYTTQIEPHDYIAELAHAMQRINTILIDFSRDSWGYISRGYFTQKLQAGEVGSSTMPHKVNPIDFENAEGNFGMANALFEFFARQLPTSRWQRDLVDSTVLRNLGVAFAHGFVALLALQKGVSKLQLNAAALAKDLDDNWEVLAEPIQTVMRRYAVSGAYEQLKDLSRGKRLTQQDLHTFIDGLELPDSVKAELKQLTPSNYVGLAKQLAEKI